MSVKGLLRVGRQPRWAVTLAAASAVLISTPSVWALSTVNSGGLLKKTTTTKTTTSKSSSSSSSTSTTTTPTADPATPVTFAQVEESNANADPNVFEYLNNGTPAGAELGTDVGGIFGAPIPVYFTYENVLGTLEPDLQGVQTATMTLTSSTTSAISLVGGGLATEPFSAGGTVTDTLTITRSTPAAEGGGGRTNLLTMVFTGSLSGTIGGDTPQLSGNTSLGNTVTYTSDFVDFSKSTVQDFNMAFSSWNTVNSSATGFSEGSDDFFNTATAAGDGTFDFGGLAVGIPEPATLPLVAFAGLGVLMMRRRSSRRA